MIVFPHLDSDLLPLLDVLGGDDPDEAGAGVDVPDGGGGAGVVDPGEPEVDPGHLSVILEVDPVGPDDPESAETFLTVGRYQVSGRVYSLSLCYCL